jgi:hypothetical protein
MKNFTPFLLIAFILWVAFKDQLSQYLSLATTINWHIQLPWIFGGSGGSSAQGGKSGGGGGVLGAIGNEFGFVPSVLGNFAGGSSGSSAVKSGFNSASNTAGALLP